MHLFIKSRSNKISNYVKCEHIFRLFKYPKLENTFATLWMLWKKFHHASQLNNLLEFNVIYQEFQLAYVVELTLYNYSSWKALLNKPKTNKPIKFKCQNLWEDNYIIHNAVVLVLHAVNHLSAIWCSANPHDRWDISLHSNTPDATFLILVSRNA